MGEEGKVHIRFEAYVSDFLEKWGPFSAEEFSPGTACRWAISWAVQALANGMLRGLSELDSDERKAILAAENGWYWRDERIVPGGVLAIELEDFFSMGDGMEWEWDPERVQALCDKVRTWDPARTVGVLLWAAKFWEKVSESGGQLSADEYIKAPVK